MSIQPWETTYVCISSKLFCDQICKSPDAEKISMIELIFWVGRSTVLKSIMKQESIVLFLEQAEVGWFRTRYSLEWYIKFSKSQRIAKGKERIGFNSPPIMEIWQIQLAIENGQIVSALHWEALNEIEPWVLRCLMTMCINRGACNEPLSGDSLL